VVSAVEPNDDEVMERAETNSRDNEKIAAGISGA
jgi:hypothetical protein